MCPTLAHRRRWLQQAPQPQPTTPTCNRHALYSKGKEPRAQLTDSLHAPRAVDHQGRRQQHTLSTHSSGSALKEPQEGTTGAANRVQQHSMRRDTNHHRRKTNRHCEARPTRPGPFHRQDSTICCRGPLHTAESCSSIEPLAGDDLPLRAREHHPMEHPNHRLIPCAPSRSWTGQNPG